MARVARRGARLVLRVVVLIGLTVAAITLGASIAGVWVAKVVRFPAQGIVNDVTQLNPIHVREVITPTTTEEISAAVRSHAGPISIGGGRFSMGGQTATDGALQIDMRRFNRILAFDSIGKTITVQAGTRWRQIQERIDKANLSVKIMQTYANFTVGGSLSVNVHGRYVGLGPLVTSVRSIKLVLADGSILEASRESNPGLFYGAIGGYGALGVITEATLELTDNVRVKRWNRRMRLGAYKHFFMAQVRDEKNVVFHNADLYPPSYDRVNAVSYIRTDEPVTVPDRLVPANQSYRLDHFVYSVIAGWPGGKAFRQYVVDPLLFRGSRVEWRNYEASYDVAELEPSSRADETYVLQEYFVPMDALDAFVPKMRAVFEKHDVNVINVSIRHAFPDPGTLLAWAPREVFALVVYYRQGTDPDSRRDVAAWTREMTDSILTVGGSYYLPYQPHATPEQFARAYPRAGELFALKRVLDPTNKFRSKLWDAYYLPRIDPSAAPLSGAGRTRLDSAATYRRDEGQTFLTHPEWYIVYSSDEYAAWLRDKLPTSFPYLTSIGQYWSSYRQARVRTQHGYRFNAGYHVMLGVIGVSYSAELALKGLYENSVGRFSGWTAGHQLSDEDRFAYAVANDYAQFIHVYPWYRYAFSAKLHALWTQVPVWGDRWFRKLERRAFLSVEYGIKAAYAALIESATRAAYAPEDQRIQMVVAGWSDSIATVPTNAKVVARLDDNHTLLSMPRYDGFRDALLALARAGTGVRIDEIAGNEEILLTGVAPAQWTYVGTGGEVLTMMPVPTDPARNRLTIQVRVKELIPFLAEVQREGRFRVDHVYDY